MARTTDSHSQGGEAARPGRRWRTTDLVGNDPGTSVAESDSWRRYHCPVCGHQDRVSVGVPQTTIDCSHCSTTLLVSMPEPLSESATVRVDLGLRSS